MANNQNQPLDESHFIRHQLFAGKQGVFGRYAAIVLAKPTLLRLLRYELITMLGPIPGALGLFLRKLFYPFLFARVGKGVIFGRNITVRHPDKISLGDHVILDDSCLLDGRGATDLLCLGDRVIVNRNAFVQSKFGDIRIGPDTSIGSDSKVIAQGSIEIGSNVSIAGSAYISGGRFVVERQKDSITDKRRFSTGGIRIEKDCRIGILAIIEDGVSIGEGAIIAPGSVVIGDVAAYTVVVGNPAHLWRAREFGGSLVNDHAPEAANLNVERGEGGDPVYRAIKSHLEDTYFAEFDSDHLASKESLFDNGVLDSVALLNLVLWLEQEFAISISHSELLPSNFETLDGMTAFVRGKRANVAS